MPWFQAFSTALESGIVDVVLGAVGVVGEVEDPDVQPVGVAVLDDPVDRCDHLRDVDGAGVVGDLDAHDPGVGGDPDEVDRVAGRSGSAPGVRPAMIPIMWVP